MKTKFVAAQWSVVIGLRFTVSNFLSFDFCCFNTVLLLKDSSRRVLASSLVLISNLSLFRREQNGTIKPVYKKAAFNLDLVLELVAQAHEHCKTEYALIDLDEQTHGHIIEQLFERDAHCVAFASEVYDCGVGVGCSHLLSNDWNARFLDPRLAFVFTANSK